MTVWLRFAWLPLACAPSDDTGESAFYYAPDAPGPWTAGTVESAFAGPGAADQAVQVWFPTTAADGDAYR